MREKQIVKQHTTQTLQQKNHNIGEQIKLDSYVTHQDNEFKGEC